MARGEYSCDDHRRAQQWTRRAALEAGWLGTLGLSLPTLFAGQTHASTDSALTGFGRAKRCILLFMWGGPSQLDTWDLKPEAPDEIRGEFKPIATSVPGTNISEHFPKLARRAHQYAIIRSMTHDDRAHLSSAHHALTGCYAPKRFSDADPPSPKDSPHIGSVIARMQGESTGIPGFVMMPWIVSHPAAPGGKAPGQHGGWMGRSYDPFLIGDPNAPDFRVPGCMLPREAPRPRLESRRQLLERLDQVGGSFKGNDWGDVADRATRMILDPRVSRAFDLSAEPAPLRDLYGRNTHGQSVLMARRLAEAGVPLVTVNWHDDGQNFWDTHGQNFVQLRNRLMPTADAAFSALLDDLDARGLLDETLVVWAGEFGRRPQITKHVAGREHWPRCYSVVLAGGGIRGGAVYGSSDRIAAAPSENPVTPGDLIATIYHALGVPADLTLADRESIPKHLVQGKSLQELFS